MASNVNIETAQYKPAVHWGLTFIRAQLSAFLGGACDYVIMIMLTEWVGLFYTSSIIISGICGAIINYSINRYWTFKATDVPAQNQLFKFVFVVIGSITLK